MGFRADSDKIPESTAHPSPKQQRPERLAPSHGEQRASIGYSQNLGRVTCYPANSPLTPSQVHLGCEARGPVQRGKWCHSPRLNCSDLCLVKKLNSLRKSGHTHFRERRMTNPPATLSSHLDLLPSLPAAAIGHKQACEGPRLVIRAGGTETASMEMKGARDREQKELAPCSDRSLMCSRVTQQADLQSSRPSFTADLTKLHRLGVPRHPPPKIQTLLSWAK